QRRRAARSAARMDRRKLPGRGPEIRAGSTRIGRVRGAEKETRAKAEAARDVQREEVNALHTSPGPMSNVPVVIPWRLSRALGWSAACALAAGGSWAILAIAAQDLYGARIADPPYDDVVSSAAVLAGVGALWGGLAGSTLSLRHRLSWLWP